MIVALQIHARRSFVLSFIMLAIWCPATLLAQPTNTGHYWVYLNHRTPSTLTAAELGITPRAMKRREKVLPPGRVIDQFDDPIPEALINQIRATGATVRTTSRWLNAVSVGSTQSQLNSISTLPFVKRIAPLGILTFRLPHPFSSAAPRELTKSQKVGTLDYGPSLEQLATIHITDLHALGVNGTGVIVGMIDDGFNNHRTHVALKNIHVIAEYDFIHNITDTEAQPWEDPTQGLHGAGTLSSVAGFDPGNLIGGAFGASILLAKTEMDSSGDADFRSEEDTYVAGLEWMERMGADIASSSLAYKIFDPPDSSYSYSSMNGHTTIVAQAAAIAAQKGVLLCTAMGNEGTLSVDSSGDLVPTPGTLWSPADADSIVSVGATSIDGTVVASFSSTGPTADGRIKPEVVAPGEDVYWAYGNSTDEYWSVQGTSAATPLTASAAALVLSAHPELTPMQVRQALMNTAEPLTDAFPSLQVPNYVYGSGLVNAYSAVLSEGLAFSNLPIVTSLNGSYIVTTWIASNDTLVADSLAFFYRFPSDSVFTRVPLAQTPEPNEYRAVISSPPSGIVPIGYFSAFDGAGHWRSPYDAPDSLFSIEPTPDSVRQFYPDSAPISELLPASYVLKNNFPNPFNSTTTIQFYAPTTDHVELTVFNLLGQRVKTLFSVTQTPLADWNTVRWNDAKDDYGRSVSSGVYFARLKTLRSVLTLKMVYVK